MDAGRDDPAPGDPDRAALYRRGATPEQMAALRARIADLDHERAETARGSEASLEHADVIPAVGARLRSRGRWIAIPLLIAVAACAAAVAVGTLSRTSAPSAAQSRAAHAVTESRGALAPASFFQRFPEALPVAGRSISAVGLDGATPVDIPGSSARTDLLLVVACGTADRSYEYTTTALGRVPRTIAHGFGACGTLRPIVLRVRPRGATLRVLVVTRGVDPFSVSAYSR